jgi:Nuclease-related domain
VRDRLYPYYCGAGRGARAKYRDVSGRWRKRIFRRPWLIAAALGAPVFVVAVLEHHNRWLWLLGVLLGGLLGLYAALLESPPARIENWRTGFEGERRTARALAPLRRCGYVLLHDLADRRRSGQDHKGNIDHVVVSPTGVFLLDSKWLGGEASIAGDTVHVQMRDDDEDSYNEQWSATGVRGRAARLRDDIAQQTDVRRVKAVMVFWNDFDAGLVEGENIIFVHGDRLVGWLQEQRGQMSPDWVTHVAACIKDARPPEHRTWSDRRPTFGHRARSAAAASSRPGGVAAES